MEKKHILLLFLVTTLISACTGNVSAMAQPTGIDISALQTATVSDIIAQITQTAVSLATPTQDTASTPPPTNTTSPDSAGSIGTSADCEASFFISDSSINDGTQLSAGQEFIKTWKIKNSGSCPWKKNSALVFGYGNKMAGTPVELSTDVPPGNEIEISITMKAPDLPGNYSGFWCLANDRGLPFGQFFSVVITVP